MTSDIVRKALATLEKEGVILYPTDTIWGLGCDARSTHAVEAIYRLKQRTDAKALICLVADKEMLTQWVGNFPKALDPYLEDPRPTTIIYPQVKGISSSLGAPDGSVGIRVVKDAFCQSLIHALNAPLVSTSANISGHQSPRCYDEIDKAILLGADHIVPLRQEEKNTKASRIVRLNAEGNIEILRD